LKYFYESGGHDSSSGTSIRNRKSIQSRLRDL
jgi:hypothetical protein